LEGETSLGAGFGLPPVGPFCVYPQTHNKHIGRVVDVPEAFYAENLITAEVTEAEINEIYEWSEEIIKDLRETVSQVSELKPDEIDMQTMAIECLKLGFLAGTVFQRENGPARVSIPVEMSPEAVTAFINFLVERVSE